MKVLFSTKNTCPIGYKTCEIEYYASSTRAVEFIASCIVEKACAKLRCNPCDMIIAGWRGY